MGEGSKNRLHVEVAYALPLEQVLLQLEVEEGTTVAQAVELSGLLVRFPELRPDGGNLGIFGKPVSPDAPVQEGDRVELYRPLVADPKAARRERAKKR
jgi:putative ubiquitin-RnfH superfamily antitoxin RatB of RatAB toxin-antitoxin module